MSSLSSDAITSWNNVITHFDSIPSIKILKDHIVSVIRPKKKNNYGIHDPSGLRYLLHNFIDTPCGKSLCNHGIEDSNHFLFFVLFTLLKDQP